jgi:16S rRNA (cytosine967-C5)-methyltransferase
MSGSVSLAREIAYDTYYEVMYNKKRPEDVLEQLYTQHDKALKRLDRNFIKEIVYGSLRWHSKMYWILQKTSSRKLEDVSPYIQTALVCGTYQIYYMDRVPDRAAVNESVEYVRKKGQANACSFANGILRQIARRAEYFQKPDKVTQQVDYLSLQFAHPKWLVERWCEYFKFERMEQVLASNNQPPPNTIRANAMKIHLKDIAELQQNLLKEERTHSDRRPLRSTLVLKEYPRLGEDTLFARGWFTFQDESSQLIAHLVDPKPGETIIDACCAPGGKLTHLYELGEGQVHLIGIDKTEDKLGRVRENIKRLGHHEDKFELIAEDFNNYKPSKPFNKILLDAPCSALGILRRHPEGKWHKSPEIIKQMQEIQRQLLKHAIEMCSSGNEVIYSVCSFELEESVGHLKWIKSQFGDSFEVVSPVSRLPDYYKRFVTRDNVLLIYAGNQDNMDGFSSFIVRKK